MQGHFYNEIGLKFETIEVKGCVEEGKFKPDSNKSSTSRVVTLDSLVDGACLGDIIDGADAAAKLATLKAFWDPTATGVTDTAVFAARADLKLQSNLIANAVDDESGTPTGRSIHDTSHQNILPIGASRAWKALTLSAADAAAEKTRAEQEQNRAIIEILEGPFNKIRSHSSADLAWQAYVQWYDDGKPEKDPIYFVQ